MPQLSRSYAKLILNRSTPIRGYTNLALVRLPFSRHGTNAKTRHRMTAIFTSNMKKQKTRQIYPVSIGRPSRKLFYARTYYVMTLPASIPVVGRPVPLATA